LLLTSSAKPDGRLKSTKLLKQIATVQEFSLLPSWDSDGILKQVKAEAVAQQIRLSPAAAELLAVAVGNDARKLAMELEKLVLFAGETADSISAEMVQQLVPASAYNSFQVATALRQGNLDHALESLTHLLDHNEPALKILAVLVGQFRTWLWVKLMTEQGERDPKAIAQAAEIGNPNRVYFLQKEVLPVTGKSLHLSLSILLQLEYSLKRGQPEREAFPLALLRISQIFQRQRDLR
jgi:DNA polymerase-3 subunit delta